MVRRTRESAAAERPKELFIGDLLMNVGRLGKRVGGPNYSTDAAGSASGAGEISGTCLHRAAALDLHAQAMPSVLGHAARRVAHEVALAEFLEDAQEDRA